MNRIIAVAMTTAVGISMLSIDSQARVRTHSGTVSRHGHTATYNTSVTRTPGDVEKTKSLTGPDGKTVTKDVSNTYDKSTGQGTYSKTTTGVDGKTLTKTGTLTKNSDGTYTKQGTITGPNGNSVPVDKTY